MVVGNRHAARSCCAPKGAVLVALCALLLTERAAAIKPDSPEVVDMVSRGLKYLETRTDEQLGGKCLIGLAFYKRGMPENHPAIKAAVDACRASVETEAEDSRIYSKAIAVIFLTEVNAKAHRDLIQKYAALVVQHQMPHGGFGYKLEGDLLGDTSQTQYAALAYWEMLQIGMTPRVESVEACANWLLRTQAPDGAWAYQGRDPKSFDRMEQSPKSSCMLSAGLSSVLICGNMLGILKPAQLHAAAVPARTINRLPAVVKRVDDDAFKPATLENSGAVNLTRLIAAHRDGRQWLDDNFDVSNGSYYPHYALYALERYKSFEEYLEGDVPEEPEWYNQGYEWLKKNQQPEGNWLAAGEASAPVSTAFSVLFLLRSTQASIKQRLGEGTLVGGRGLPRDLSRVKLRGGRVFVEQQPTDLDKILEMLENAPDDADPLVELAAQPNAILVGDAGDAQAKRFERLAREGKPSERLVAVEALGRMRQVERAPTLIFALSDPDRRVVRAARDALMSVSREFEGFGPPDNFDEPERDDAIDAWKSWYARMRPDEPLP